MTRISLKEAYDNRDVIAQLVRLRDDVDELLAILKDINPSGDLTNIVTKTGNQTIDGEKTFIGKIIADCDIIQNGAAYETHAEQIFSHNDYLVMRDGAVNGLAAGDYSGLQVKKYNGSDDCRMVVDNLGVMRLGKINDEQPLLLRAEEANMRNNSFAIWDSTNKRVATPSSSDGASGIQHHSDVELNQAYLRRIGDIAVLSLRIRIPTTSLSAGTTIATLPVGYRPVTSIPVNLMAMGGTHRNLAAHIDTAGRLSNFFGTVAGTDAYYGVNIAFHVN